MNDTELLARALSPRNEHVKALAVPMASYRGKTAIALLMFTVGLTTMFWF